MVDVVHVLSENELFKDGEIEVDDDGDDEEEDPPQDLDEDDEEIKQDDNEEELLQEDEEEDINDDDEIEIKQEKKIIPKSDRVTFPFLTEYEKILLIGFRLQQILNGSKILVQTSLTDPLQIALQELKEKTIPFKIERRLPNGCVEIWSIDEFMSI